jgi:hypothetical protein
MIKRSGFIIIIICLNISVYSQVNLAKKGVIDRFLKSKTLMVREQAFSLLLLNQYLEKYMKNLWNITEYECISLQEFEEKRFDENYSFLIFSEATLKEGGTTYSFNVLNLLMGGKGAKNFSDMEEVITLPFSYMEIDDEYWTYKLGILIQVMQFYVELSKNNPDINLRQELALAEKEVKELELWLTTEDLCPELQSLEDIRKHYPYAVRIVENEDIKDAILEKKKGIAMLYRIGPDGIIKANTKCWKVILRVEDGKPLYYSSDRVKDASGDGLLPQDFRKLAK